MARSIGALNYAPERIVEVFYNVAVTHAVEIGVGGQHVEHPGYNRDRGPVSILGIRVHVEF